MRTLRNTIAILSILMTFGGAGAASAQIFTGIYDFAGQQYAHDFTAVRHGSQIDGGLDLGGTGNTALNFTGPGASVRDTWLTKWTPGGATQVLNGRCEITTAANVLIHRFNNRKGAGVVALLNDANPGDKGLAFTLYDNGNTDAIQLATIDPFTGKLFALKTLPLIAPVAENAWYVLAMRLQVDLSYDGHSMLVEAFVLSHEDPSDPNSDPDRAIGYLSYSTFGTSLEAIGLQPSGQVGILASAISAVVDSSVTTWGAIEGIEGPCWP